MIIEREVDCGQIYEQQRHVLISLSRSLDNAQRRTMVPATPAWSVADVVAHLVGITSDLNAGRFGSGDADAWTAAQVHTRRERSIDELATSGTRKHRSSSKACACSATKIPAATTWATCCSTRAGHPARSRRTIDRRRPGARHRPGLLPRLVPRGAHRGRRRLRRNTGPRRDLGARIRPTHCVVGGEPLRALSMSRRQTQRRCRFAVPHGPALWRRFSR